MQDPQATDVEETGVTRRRVLQASGGLGLLALILGVRQCSEGGSEPARDGEQPFDVWEELRLTLRTSPDHLPARAEELVASQDGAGLFALVRDAIVTLPGDDAGIGKESSVRWGARATLRCGAGTPREKAELLADLLRQAGYQAEVRGVRRPIRGEEAQAVLFRPVNRIFAPEVAPEQIARWGQQLGMTEEQIREARFVDAEGEAAKALGQKLYGMLRADGESLSSKFDWRWGANKPVIAFRRGDQSGVCDLFAGEQQAFGSLLEGEDARMVDLAPAEATLPVEVTLSAVRAGKVREPIELVHGRWSADQLAGRQLHVRLVPAMDLDQMGVRQASEVPAFLPVMGVQGGDLERDEMDALSVSGPAISPSGTQLSLDDDDIEQANSGSNAEAAQRVVRVEVQARAAGFPRVQLAVRALDAQGQLVDGLGAKDFAVEDEGRPAVALLTRSRSRPRVVVLHDESLSMPIEYRGKGMETFLVELEGKLIGAVPEVELIGRSISSDLWTSLSRASAEGPDLIVMVTDGDQSDQLTPQIEAMLKAGPPAVILDVDSRGAASFQSMAELTQGSTFPVESTDAAMQVVTDVLGTLPISPYLLEYGAPQGDPEVRNVHVGVNGSSAERAWGQYEVPGGDGELTSGLVGLYLTVKVGKHSVTRTLAGYDPDVHAGIGEQGWMQKQVQQRVWSAFLLCFEADGVPNSVALDDVLGAKLSMRKATLAVRAGDPGLLRERLAEGMHYLPHSSLNLCPVLPQAVRSDSLTWTRGLRVILERTDVDLAAGERVSRVDMLPLARIRTAMEDPEVAFERNLEHTAHLALVEREGWAVSTGSQLEGQEWVTKKAARGIGFLDGADDPTRRWWRERVDRGGDYAIHGTRNDLRTAYLVLRESGELYPILEDGSGGGLNSSQIEQLRELDFVVDSYLQLLGAAGVGGVSVGIVAQYAKTLVKLYAYASEAIILMDASFLDDALEAAFKALACEIAKEIAFGLGGGVGQILSGIDYLLNYSSPDGSGSPFSC